jgi:hypothetical protein
VKDILKIILFYKILVRQKYIEEIILFFKNVFFVRTLLITYLKYQFYSKTFTKQSDCIFFFLIIISMYVFLNLIKNLIYLKQFLFNSKCCYPLKSKTNNRQFLIRFFSVSLCIPFRSRLAAPYANTAQKFCAGAVPVL